MTFLEAHKAFREIEDQYNLFNWKIEGFPVWDYLRFPVWYKFLEATGTCAKAHHTQPNRNSLTRVKNWARLLKNTALHNPFFESECEYLFLGPGGDRRKQTPDNKLIDIYCDPIIDHIGPDRCILLEPPGNTFHSMPPYTKRLKHTDVFSIYRRCKRKRGFPLVLSNEDAKKLTQTEQAFRKYIDSTQNLDLLTLLRQKHQSHQITSSLLEKLLTKMKPKAVFLICSYSKEPYIAACRKRGIPTIELQHGVMTPYHPGYSYPQGTSKNLFPDYFFSFGNYWQETVNLPLAQDRIFAIGYPYFDQQYGSFKKRHKKNIILFISQGIVGDRLSRFAVDLAKQLPATWEITYKLHPGEIANWRGRYTELANSCIKVIADDSPPLYQLMAEAKMQVGVSSTALFEGLGFGCQTFIVDFPGYEYMQPLLDKGICKFVRSPEDIAPSLKTLHSTFKRDHFFAEKWQINLAQAFKNLDLPI